MIQIGPDGILSDSSPAVLLQNFGLIRAVEEFALEELHGNDSEDEHEEDVDDEDVQHVLERIHNAVKHCLEHKKRADGRLNENSRGVGTTLVRIKSLKLPRRTGHTIQFRIKHFGIRLSLSAASSVTSSHDVPCGAPLEKYLADI